MPFQNVSASALRHRSERSEAAGLVFAFREANGFGSEQSEAAGFLASVASWFGSKRSEAAGFLMHDFRKCFEGGDRRTVWHAVTGEEEEQWKQRKRKH